MYGTTEKKITHIIDESREKGWGGFVNTVCGKWIRPDWLTQDRPDGTRMCKLCAKKEATMKFRTLRRGRFLMLLKVHQGQDSVVGFIALTVQYIVNTRIVRNLSMPAPTKPLA